LLAIGVWIAYGKKSAANLEREITVLSERIRQVRAAGDDTSMARMTAEFSWNEKDGKIDWKDISGKLAGMHSGGMSDMRANIRLQRLLMDMSAEELCAQLDEIAALDLDDNTRKQLEGTILGILAEKDPKLVLERFSDDIGDENSGGRWHLNVALAKWAEQEPAAAAAWLDRQIAAGKLDSKSLDGKSQYRIQFEGALVNVLLKTDPTAASGRVAALPEDQREDFLKHGLPLHAASATGLAAYAKVVRENLPAGKIEGVLANSAGNLSMHDGYERIDGFIAGVNASDKEKQAIVERVIQNKLGRSGGAEISVEDLEKARAWGATQSPGVVDKATGEALAATLWSGGDFKTTSEMVLQYNARSGNDEVLAAFLKSSQLRNRSADEARTLIDQIKDPTLREEIRALPEFRN
jgi:hypothetical protein